MKEGAEKDQRTSFPKKKLGIGAALAACGSLGIFLGLILGAGDLERPWGFLLGLLLGIATGCGAALSVFGLLEIKRMR